MGCWGNLNYHPGYCMLRLLGKVLIYKYEIVVETSTKVLITVLMFLAKSVLREFIQVWHAEVPSLE